MLLEIAVGDAYGAGFEYIPMEIVNMEIVKKENNLQKYLQHQKHKDLKPGCYTDDTQMSIGIAELLVEKKEWTPLNIASKFVEVFKRDPRKGYASRFYDFLQMVDSGEEFLARIHPNSDKSGAAMRAPPIGILSETEKVIKYATIQAAVTHNTPSGINAAVASALMSHYFIHNQGKKKDLFKFVNHYVPGNWDTWSGKVGSKGYMSVRAALTAVHEENSLSGVLRRAVDFGGDVDTVAAIALGAASCSSEITQDLPDNLIQNLENGAFGREYLIKLDQRLKKC